MNKIKKILAANRSEIAIRIFRAAEESGTVSYTHLTLPTILLV